MSRDPSEVKQTSEVAVHIYYCAMQKLTESYLKWTLLPLLKVIRSHLHCPQMGPYLSDRVLTRNFLHFGSLLSPHFHCSGFINAKNVNSVCMYTTVSYLDLSVMSMNCTVVIHICWELMLQVFIIKDN